MGTTSVIYRGGIEETDDRCRESICAPRSCRLPLHHGQGRNPQALHDSHRPQRWPGHLGAWAIHLSFPASHPCNLSSSSHILSCWSSNWLSRDGGVSDSSVYSVIPSGPYGHHSFYVTVFHVFGLVRLLSSSKCDECPWPLTHRTGQGGLPAMAPSKFRAVSGSGPSTMVRARPKATALLLDTLQKTPLCSRLSDHWRACSRPPQRQVTSVCSPPNVETPNPISSGM